MKNENALNAYLGKELRKLSPRVHTIKISDKFTSGISDFLLYTEGTSIAVEVKFVPELPSYKAQLLQHPFTGEQLTFLESIDLTNNRAFGLVVIGKMAYPVPACFIPETGNWMCSDFVGAFEGYQLTEIPKMLGAMMEVKTYARKQIIA